MMFPKPWILESVWGPSWGPESAKLAPRSTLEGMLGRLKSDFVEERGFQEWCFVHPVPSSFFASEKRPKKIKLMIPWGGPGGMRRCSGGFGGLRYLRNTDLSSHTATLLCKQRGAGLNPPGGGSHRRPSNFAFCFLLCGEVLHFCRHLFVRF